MRRWNIVIETINIVDHCITWTIRYSSNIQVQFTSTPLSIECCHCATVCPTVAPWPGGPTRLRRDVMATTTNKVAEPHWSKYDEIQHVKQDLIESKINCKLVNHNKISYVPGLRLKNHWSSRNTGTARWAHNNPWYGRDQNGTEILREFTRSVTCYSAGEWRPIRLQCLFIGE